MFFRIFVSKPVFKSETHVFITSPMTFETRPGVFGKQTVQLQSSALFSRFSLFSKLPLFSLFFSNLFCVLFFLILCLHFFLLNLL